MSLAPWPPEPIVLQGDVVRLEPLTPDHAAGLAEAARDGELWNLWVTAVPSPEAIPAWIDTALALQRAGRALPFVVRRLRDERIVGSTRYMNIEEQQRRLEIGTTWYARSVQRSALNTECKKLVLKHAFE